MRYEILSVLCMDTIFLVLKLHVATNYRSKTINRRPHKNPTTYESGCHPHKSWRGQSNWSFRWNTNAEKIRRSLKVIDIRHTSRSSANVGGIANSVLVLPMVDEGRPAWRLQMKISVPRLCQVSDKARDKLQRIQLGQLL